LGWSANLRMRTVKALTFLEAAGLVIVDSQNSKITVNEKGRMLLSMASRDESNLAYTLNIIRTNYLDIKTEKQISLDLS
ncbi:MAG: hypothetical protein WBC83_01945, partial [Minisyncoccia bacterium]